MTPIIRDATTAPPATFKPHPKRDVVPPLSPEERDAVRESMLALGQQLQPISVTPEMTILDGHNRWEIARELGWSELAYIVVDVPAGLQVDYMIRTAVERRQLAADGWRGLVAKLKADGWSNRRIAEAIGKPKSTVHDLGSGVRSRTPEGTPARVTGKDGKSYAAKAPARPRAVRGTGPDLISAMEDGLDKLIATYATPASAPMFSDEPAIEVDPSVAGDVPNIAGAPSVKKLAKATGPFAIARTGRGTFDVWLDPRIMVPPAGFAGEASAKDIKGLEGLNAWLTEYLRLWHEAESR